MAEPARRRLEPVPEAGAAPLPTSFMETPVYQAYQALRIGFIVAPIVAGADKFFNLLTNWDQYLAPIIPSLTGISARGFMLGVGVIEIIAGIGVAIRPRVFGYVVSAWLGGIVLNLLIQGNYLDIALRDVGLAIGAFALGKLSQRYDLPSRGAA